MGLKMQIFTADTKNALSLSPSAKTRMDPCKGYIEGMQSD